MRAQIRRDLTAAMKTRDATATVVLRSALAAIENAKAVVPADDDASGSEHVAGAVLGVGASDVPRRTLTSSACSAPNGTTGCRPRQRSTPTGAPTVRTCSGPRPAFSTGTYPERPS